MVREDPKEELGLPAKVCRELCQIGGNSMQRGRGPGVPELEDLCM